MARRQTFQFKITLQNIKPPIWRRIQVSDLYSFWDLHVAIQDAMGWYDCHLHEFYTFNPETGEEEHIGFPEYTYGESPEDYETLPGWEFKIRHYFSYQNRVVQYLYDFGDNWEHIIEFEKECEKLEGQKYPVCLAGERACPPEDVGGVWGYENFLEIIFDPSHADYERMISWVGGLFYPEKFDPQKVKFDNPRKRWMLAFKQNKYFDLK